MKVSVVIEKDHHGYYAFSPELEGCQSQGMTFEEALANVREAVELYLETLTPEEIRERVSQEIMTTSLEVTVAWTPAVNRARVGGAVAEGWICPS
jgi:predicted RNase H-like HicB family nuclease